MLVQLEKDVKRVQGSNLILAQNAWFAENNDRLNGGMVANAPAQQLAVTKVTPLHVNLPTRGIRYSFTQVLETEINKPMTIGMLAENTKVPSWILRAAYSLLAFVALWITVAIVARRREA